MLAHQARFDAAQRTRVVAEFAGLGDRGKAGLQVGGQLRWQLREHRLADCHAAQVGALLGAFEVGLGQQLPGPGVVRPRFDAVADLLHDRVERGHGALAAGIEQGAAQRGVGGLRGLRLLRRLFGNPHFGIAGLQLRPRRQCDADGACNTEHRYEAVHEGGSRSSIGWRTGMQWPLRRR